MQANSLPAEPQGSPRILEWVAYPFFCRSCWFDLQGSNWSLLHCRWILYQLSYEGNPNVSKVLCDVYKGHTCVFLLCLLLMIRWCYGKRYVDVLTPSTTERDLEGHGRCDYSHSLGLVGAYCSLTDVLIRRQPCEGRDTRRRPCEDGGRDWSHASVNQGTPGIAGER